MVEVKSYQDLKVWQKAMDLVFSVYKLSKSFPKDETYGLTSQIRRASVSVPSNIAEGWGRGSTKSYLQFLRIGRGSLTELETQLIIAHQLDYLSIKEHDDLESLLKEVGRMLNGLIRNLEKNL